VNELRLRIRRVAPDQGWEVRLLVDGIDVIGRSGTGMDPDTLLPRGLSATAPGHRVVLVCCGCGDVGCGSASAVIRRAGDVVTWKDWETDLALDLPTYRFAADQYDEAVARADRDRGWEPSHRTAARHARALLDPGTIDLLRASGLREPRIVGTDRGAVEVWMHAGVRDEGHWQVFLDVTGLEPKAVIELLRVEPMAWQRATWFPNDGTASRQSPPMAGPAWRRSPLG